jgi:hypothetical protein
MGNTGASNRRPLKNQTDEEREHRRRLAQRRAQRKQKAEEAFQSSLKRLSSIPQRQKRAKATGKKIYYTKGDRLILYRMVLRDGITQADAARQLGINPTTAWRWIKELNENEPDTVARLRNEMPRDPVPWDQLGENARRACDDFWFYRTHYKDRRTPPWAVESAGQILALYESDREEYVAFNAPPGAGKTTLLDDILEWIIVRQRARAAEPTVLLGHRAHDKAKLYVDRMRSTFTYNRGLISDFGRFQPSSPMHPWSRSELVVEPLEWADRKEKEPTVSAASYEGATIAGRYKVIKWDDLVDQANSLSAEQRQKLVDWWETIAETRLEPAGLLILAGSRFGPEDLFHHVVTLRDWDEEDDTERLLYTHIRFPAHFDNLCRGVHAPSEHPRPYPEGCILDPERVSWRKIRGAQVRSEGRYRLVWQQEDSDPSGSLAEPEWFKGGIDSRGRDHNGCFNYDRSFGQRPREDSPVLSAITVDPGASKFWGIEHWLVYTDGLQALFQGDRRPMGAHELLYRENDGTFTGVLEDMWQRAATAGVPPSHVVFEDRSMQKHFIHYPFVFEWCRARGVVVVPHDTNRINKADKETGPEMLNPLYRDGKVDLPYAGYEERMFSDVFMREAVNWPEGSSTDLVMAHWFLAYRLPTLIIAVSPAEPNFERPNIPDWADVQAPEWATELLPVGA